jgi:hypothetical protein
VVHSLYGDPSLESTITQDAPPLDLARSSSILRYSSEFELSTFSDERDTHRFVLSQALGRIQNRFAKDLEGIDSGLPDNFGRSLMYGLGVLTTLVVVSS